MSYVYTIVIMAIGVWSYINLKMHLDKQERELEKGEYYHTVTDKMYKVRPDLRSIDDYLAKSTHSESKNVKSFSALRDELLDEVRVKDDPKYDQDVRQFSSFLVSMKEEKTLFYKKTPEGLKQMTLRDYYPKHLDGGIVVNESESVFLFMGEGKAETIEVGDLATRLSTGEWLLSNTTLTKDRSSVSRDNNIAFGISHSDEPVEEGTIEFVLMKERERHAPNEPYDIAHYKYKNPYTPLAQPELVYRSYLHTTKYSPPETEEEKKMRETIEANRPAYRYGYNTVKRLLNELMVSHISKHGDSVWLRNRAGGYVPFNIQMVQSIKVLEENNREVLETSYRLYNTIYGVQLTDDNFLALYISGGV